MGRRGAVRWGAATRAVENGRWRRTSRASRCCCVRCSFVCFSGVGGHAAAGTRRRHAGCCDETSRLHAIGKAFQLLRAHSRKANELRHLADATAANSAVNAAPRCCATRAPPPGRSTHVLEEREQAGDGGGGGGAGLDRRTVPRQLQKVLGGQGLARHRVPPRLLQHPATTGSGGQASTYGGCRCSCMSAKQGTRTREEQRAEGHHPPRAVQRHAAPSGCRAAP